MLTTPSSSLHIKSPLHENTTLSKFLGANVYLKLVLLISKNRIPRNQLGHLKSVEWDIAVRKN